MSVKLRVLTMAGVILLACCGCQKGTKEASTGSPDMAEASKADASMAPEHSSKKSAAPAEAKKSSTPERAPSSVPKGVLTEASNGMEFDFRQGQTITVVLDSNRASGLSWAVVEPMGSVIVPQGTSSYAVRSGTKAGGMETWHFRAAKAGYQTVKMEYRRKWTTSMPERTFRFSGTVR